MGVEIERKFLVLGDTWRAGPDGLLCRQGYLSAGVNGSVRVRVLGEHGFLTIKGRHRGISRPEYEYAIPAAEANEMLDQLCPRPLVEKRRYYREHAGQRWEIDEFLAENAGLVVAEIELAAADQVVVQLEWVGLEVTDDPRYLNANLARHPFSLWASRPPA